jgi:hypothetical protein
MVIILFFLQLLQLAVVLVVAETLVGRELLFPLHKMVVLVAVQLEILLLVVELLDKVLMVD